ncbi:MAG: chorismate synthase [Oscillospiraceae bacterium]|nr:chorismate synthase [Oscillospiraceae bacterium]
MSSTTGNKIKISVFGQSHSKAIGVVIDGLPAGKKLDMEKIYAFMARRAPGQNEYSTARKETDIPEIVSGTVNGVTCGAPLCAVIHNTNPHSADYNNIIDTPRPSHADFSGFMRYNGFNDVAGGGHFSGRLTAPLCFAGAVCMQYLEDMDIRVQAHILKIKDASDESFDPISVSECGIDKKSFPVISDKAGEKMRAEIEKARENGDSVGGIIECAVTGIKAGLGDPMFDGVENLLSKNIFAVPAVKGIEFGNGFDAAELYGSENNDGFCIRDGEIKTVTNNSGGINGGITNGMPIIFKTALKPTPSIYKEQNSVSLSGKEEKKLQIKGRHDPCVVVRAVPVIEAVTAFTLLDICL